MEKSKKGKNYTVSQGIKKPTKQEESKINKILNFYKLKETNSSISCHGRPTGKDLKSMKLTYGVNCVLTPQYAKEKPEEIKKMCEENKLKWLDVELGGATLPYFQKSDTQKLLISSLKNLTQILKNFSVNLFIHCAAGLHRTGIVVYSLLRIFGETPESALQALEYIRSETRKEVGDKRIEFAEKFILPHLLEPPSLSSLSLEDKSNDHEITEKIQIKESPHEINKSQSNADCSTNIK
jgi:protein-tyrosine phosphatase